jgi:hypothetical protein
VERKKNLMNKILVIKYCDNGLPYSDYDYKSWEENELIELPEEADPDVFANILMVETKKKYKKNNYGAKFVCAYLVSKIWEE